MGVPTVEKAPGIREPWLGIWRYALADLKESGLWQPTLRPLLDEYVVALRTAREHRDLAEGEPVETNRESGLTHMHAGFGSADKELRRAMALADALGITPRAKKALADKADEPPKETSAFAQADELAQRRSAKANA